MPLDWADIQRQVKDIPQPKNLDPSLYADPNAHLRAPNWHHPDYTQAYFKNEVYRYQLYENGTIPDRDMMQFYHPANIPAYNNMYCFYNKNLNWPPMNEEHLPGCYPEEVYNDSKDKVLVWWHTPVHNDPWLTWYVKQHEGIHYKHYLEPGNRTSICYWPLNQTNPSHKICYKVLPKWKGKKVPKHVHLVTGEDVYCAEVGFISDKSLYMEEFINTINISQIVRSNQAMSHKERLNTPGVNPRNGSWSVKPLLAPPKNPPKQIYRPLPGPHIQHMILDVGDNSRTNLAKDPATIQWTPWPLKSTPDPRDAWRAYRVPGTFPPKTLPPATLGPEYRHLYPATYPPSSWLPENRDSDGEISRLRMFPAEPLSYKIEAELRKEKGFPPRDISFPNGTWMGGQTREQMLQERGFPFRTTVEPTVGPGDLRSNLLVTVGPGNLVAFEFRDVEAGYFFPGLFALASWMFVLLSLRKFCSSQKRARISHEHNGNYYAMV